MVNSGAHLSCRDSEETRLVSPTNNTRERRKMVLLAAAHFFMVDERFEEGEKVKMMKGAKGVITTMRCDELSGLKTRKAQERL